MDGVACSLLYDKISEWPLVGRRGEREVCGEEQEQSSVQEEVVGHSAKCSLPDPCEANITMKDNVATTEGG